MSNDRSLPYFDPCTLSKLKGVTLRARGTVEGAVSGSHRSPFQGFAAEFAEHREYAPGDDLRYVDWKVYGRSDRLFVKQFEEETNFACQVLLDVSESMQYRSESVEFSKLEYAKRVAAAISYVIVKQQDAIGLVTFDRAVIQTVRPGSQPAHWKQLSHVLEEAGLRRQGTEGRGQEAEASEPEVRSSTLVFAEIAERLPKRGVVILLSDLFTDAAALISELKRFRHRQHDTLAGPVEPQGHAGALTGGDITMQMGNDNRPALQRDGANPPRHPAAKIRIGADPDGRFGNHAAQW